MEIREGEMSRYRALQVPGVVCEVNGGGTALQPGTFLPTAWWYAGDGLREVHHPHVTAALVGRRRRNPGWGQRVAIH